LLSITHPSILVLHGTEAVPHMPDLRWVPTPRLTPSHPPYQQPRLFLAVLWLTLGASVDSRK